MAHFIFILFVVTFAFVDAEDCDCNKEVDNKDFWAFLKSISENNNVSRDKAMNSVLPAVLSPLVDCGCGEKNRPKRKIMPSQPRVVAKVPVAESKENVDQIKKFRVGDKYCPTQHVRIGNKCLKLEDLWE